MNRSIGVCIILSIVTLGIYTLYWMYKINEESAQMSGEPEITSGGMLILLSIVTCSIYLIYWSYKMGERFERMRAQRGGQPGSLPVIYLLLALFGLEIVSLAMMQSEENTVVGAN